jgi:hypothetical protein
MKYKKLSKSQIIISIDRLTRFKPTEEKYLRVFRDILISALIEPKLKKSDIENLDYEELRDISVEIFNSSLENSSNDYSINEKLAEYEKSVFKFDKNTEVLIDNKLDYKSALSLIDYDNAVLNLKWLSNILNSKDLKSLRYEKCLRYPIEKVVIAEGITEEILLPEFADFCGYNFDKNGVKIIPAGGKNQVVKLYYKLREELRLPIFILLDKDAETNGGLINTRLRECDEVYLLNSGEFEDLLPKELLVRTINTEFKNFVILSEKEFECDMPTVKILEELFKDKCLHEFKKAEFAHQIKQQIKSEKDISEEVKSIICEIKNLGN